MRAVLVGLLVLVATGCEDTRERTTPELGAAATPLVPAQPARPAPSSPTDVCEQYVRRLEAIASCAAVPPDSAKALRGQIPTLRTMYAQYGHQQQVQDSCKLALDATDKAYRALGC